MMSGCAKKGSFIPGYSLLVRVYDKTDIATN